MGGWVGEGGREGGREGEGVGGNGLTLWFAMLTSVFPNKLIKAGHMACQTPLLHMYTASSCSVKPQVQMLTI